MKLSLQVRLLTLLLCLALPSCASMTRILEIEPSAPAQSDVVRILCARGKEGFFLYGPVYYNKLDTPLTTKLITAHNDAWDAATKKGSLCGGVAKPDFGSATFGGTAWGVK